MEPRKTTRAFRENGLDNVLKRRFSKLVLQSGGWHRVPPGRRQSGLSNDLPRFPRDSLTSCRPDGTLEIERPGLQSSAEP
jgi:hypothetical protein